MCFGNSGKFSLFNLLIWNQFESLVHLDLEKSLKWLGWHPPFGVTSDHVTNRNKSGEQHLGKTSQATPATWHELLNHQLLKFSLKGLEYKVSKVAVARAMKVKENQRKITTVPTLLWAYTKYLYVNVECEQNFQHSQLQLFIIIVYFFHQTRWQQIIWKSLGWTLTRIRCASGKSTVNSEYGLQAYKCNLTKRSVLANSWV